MTLHCRVAANAVAVSAVLLLRVLLLTQTQTQPQRTGSRQAQRFQAKVRYKGEGLDATKRYRHKVTRTQSRERLLLRPFQAAKGILPVVSTRRQQQ